MFEAEFRRKAIQKGLFSYSNYLEFSTKNYLENLKIINENKEIRVGDRIGNFSFIGEPNLIALNSSQYIESFLPDSFLSKESEKSAFQFSITSSKIIRGIEAIKRMLTTQARPIAYSFRVPNRIIEANCSEKGKCSKCAKDGECEKYVIRDEELNFRVGGKYSPGDPASLVIVGYNDNIPVETENGVTRGGFILRGRKPGIGHSYQYLTDEISPTQESSICHTPKLQKGEQKCLEKAQNADDCKATNLICVDDRFCENNASYALATNNKVIKIGDGVVDMSFIPLPLLQEVLSPKHAKTKACGYFLLPYYVIDEMEKYSSSQSFANDALFLSISYNHVPSDDPVISKSKSSFSNITSYLFSDISL